MEGSTRVIETRDDTGKNRTTIQTGYKRQPIGTILYVLTLLTFFGWFGLQIFCTWLYTNTEGDDKIMALKTFCAVWVSGFFWNCSLLWPFSIRFLFLRRCELSEATHVAIFQEMDTTEETKANENKNSSFRLPVPIKLLVDTFLLCAKSYFTLVFADPNSRPDNSRGRFQLCPVQYNDDGTLYLLFLFRRYNYNKMTGTFEPGVWEMEKTFRELNPEGISAVDETELALENILMMEESGHGSPPSEKPSGYRIDAYKLDAAGLSTKEAEKRYRAVGPNVMEVPPPSYFSMLSEEIAKPFYLYQGTLC